MDVLVIVWVYLQGDPTPQASYTIEFSGVRDCLISNIDDCCRKALEKHQAVERKAIGRQLNAVIHNVIFL